MGKRLNSLHPKEKSKHSPKTKKRLAVKAAMLADRAAKKGTKKS